MSDFITGREAIVALKQGVTWNTAEGVGANDGILITTGLGGAKAPGYVDDDSLGSPDILFSYRVTEGRPDTFQGYLRYEGWDVALALALGVAGTPSGSSAYSNTYYPADNIDGLFATMVAKKANTTKGIWELPSAKIHGFEIAGAIGQIATINFNVMMDKVEIENPANTTTNTDAVTYPDKANACLMDKEFRIRMNAQSGGALTDADKIFPTSFRFTYNRPQDENRLASQIAADEPTQSGFAEIGIELVFDKYSSDTFTSAISNDTDQKMDIWFQGPVIPGSEDTFMFRLDLAKVTWQSDAAPLNGPGKIGQTVTGVVRAVTSAPTGMAALTDPFRVYVQNTRSTDPLL